MNIQTPLPKTHQPDPTLILKTVASPSLSH